MPAKQPTAHDRRIRLEKPVTVANDYNETNTVWEVVLQQVPARRTEGVSSEKEGLEGAIMRASGEYEWETRYLGSIRPRANWRLVDHYGEVYDCIAPPMEMGRRQGWVFKTRLMQ
jgi:hypothetical protein